MGDYAAFLPGDMEDSVGQTSGHILLAGDNQ